MLLLHPFFSLLLLLSSWKVPAASGQLQWRAGSREEASQPLNQVWGAPQISRSSPPYSLLIDISVFDSLLQSQFVHQFVCQHATSS